MAIIYFTHKTLHTIYSIQGDSSFLLQKRKTHIVSILVNAENLNTNILYSVDRLKYITLVQNLGKSSNFRKLLKSIIITVEPRYNDPWYNDIPGITINMLCPGKSYSKMYGTEPWYNDLRYNDIPDIMMSF